MVVFGCTSIVEAFCETNAVAKSAATKTALNRERGMGIIMSLALTYLPDGRNLGCLVQVAVLNSTLLLIPGLPPPWPSPSRARGGNPLASFARGECLLYWKSLDRGRYDILRLPPPWPSPSRARGGDTFDSFTRGGVYSSGNVSIVADWITAS